MDVFKLENVSVKQGIKYILKDINWQIKPGERWVLFGPNGSGKTTLLSLLAGYHSPTEGKITLLGEEPDGNNIASLRKQIGWASTSFFDRYFTCETILEIVLAGKNGTLGCDWDEIADEDIRQAKYILRRLGLGSIMRYTYDMLSQGQRQKVILARTLMTKASVLILDEPCNGLDILTKEDVFAVLQQLVEERHLTLVYVTHHTDEIMPFFNKALFLKEGAIYEQGDIHQIFTEEKLSGFFERPTKVFWQENHLFLQIDKKRRWENNAALQEERL